MPLQHQMDINMLSVIFDFISKYPKFSVTVMLSAAGFLIRKYIDYRIFKKNDTFKQQLQKQMLKIEHLKKIYPYLLDKIIFVQLTIFNLCDKRIENENIDSAQIEELESLLVDLTVFVTPLRIDISREVEKLTIDLCKLMNSLYLTLKNNLQNKIPIYKKQIRSLIDRLREQMRKEMWS